ECGKASDGCGELQIVEGDRNFHYAIGGRRKARRLGVQYQRSSRMCHRLMFSRSAPRVHCVAALTVLVFTNFHLDFDEPRKTQFSIVAVNQHAQALFPARTLADVPVGRERADGALRAHLEAFFWAAFLARHTLLATLSLMSLEAFLSGIFLALGPGFFAGVLGKVFLTSLARARILSVVSSATTSVTAAGFFAFAFVFTFLAIGLKVDSFSAAGVSFGHLTSAHGRAVTRYGIGASVPINSSRLASRRTPITAAANSSAIF